MKVLVGRNQVHFEEAIPELESRYPGVEFATCSSPEEAVQRIGDADIYVGGINRELFLAAKKLKWIQASSTGVDYYLAIPELVRSDVLLTSARGTHAACLAESAFGMILAFTRGIRESIQRQQRHEWVGRDLRARLVVLGGSTMGIIGFGTVGRAVAKLAHAHDVRILAVDLYPAEKPGHVDELWGMERLDDLLRRSDYIVVTVPGTARTKGMIGAPQLALVKPTAMLVGISRGGIIDQVALAQALQEKRLAAAALDVFVPEPLPPDSPLWDVENLLITPHIAGGTQYEHQYLVEIFEENLQRFMRGELPLRNQVDKQEGF